MICEVPAEVASDPDLPALAARAKVVLELNVQPAAGGMPRSLEGLLGRVTSAAWADDHELEIEVAWREDVSFVPEMERFLEEGLSKLTLEVVTAGEARRATVLMVPSLPA